MPCFYNWYKSYIKMLHVLLKQIVSAWFQCLTIEFWTVCEGGFSLLFPSHLLSFLFLHVSKLCFVRLVIYVEKSCIYNNLEGRLIWLCLFFLPLANEPESKRELTYIGESSPLSWMEACTHRKKAHTSGKGTHTS